MKFSCLHVCTFSLGLVARDILTGITETGRGKQTLEDDERQIRQNTETKAKKKKGKIHHLFFTQCLSVIPLL